jgi:hypothetical protein
MPQITLDLEEKDFRDIKEAAGGVDGVKQYFQDALGLAKLVHEETKKKDHVIAITDKNGNVIKTVKPSR